MDGFYVKMTNLYRLYNVYYFIILFEFPMNLLRYRKRDSCNCLTTYTRN